MKRGRQVKTLNEVMRSDVIDCGVSGNMAANAVEWNNRTIKITQIDRIEL